MQDLHAILRGPLVMAGLADGSRAVHHPTLELDHTASSAGELCKV